MRPPQQNIVLATGFAMFSMFFGAGNIVFPLATGQHAESLTAVAFAGLVITAVGVPFLGLVSILLFNGDYKAFFARLGTWPGFILSVFIMGLIGPFGAIPRCITLSYSTAKMYFPVISLPVFSIFSCLLIYALTIRKNRILDILGYILTPFLIFTLIIIILKGILEAHSMPQSQESLLAIFFKGVTDGYLTMDLLGAFFFSSVVINGLKSDLEADNSRTDVKNLIFLAIKASLIGAALLALVYAGFSTIAAYNSVLLKGIPQDEMLGVLTRNILGNYAGFIATLCVALACLTTAMALASVSADFFHRDITQEKLSYPFCLMAVLAATFFISTLQFNGIAHFLQPILELCYPALIVLSSVNLAYKLTGFKPVRPLFYGALAATLLIYGTLFYFE